MPVSVQAILDSGDCSRDVWLEWGDRVEIPETDHPVSVAWLGFPTATLTKLQNCLQRQVHLTVKGQTTNLFLSIRTSQPTDDPDPIINYPPPQFCLLAVVQYSGLLRTSSDLARVKVTRHNSKTGENWERVFDCTASPTPALWLRDGDMIDVPDKP